MLNSMSIPYNAEGQIGINIICAHLYIYIYNMSYIKCVYIYSAGIQHKKHQLKSCYGFFMFFQCDICRVCQCVWGPSGLQEGQWSFRFFPGCLKRETKWNCMHSLETSDTNTATSSRQGIILNHPKSKSSRCW